MLFLFFFNFMQFIPAFLFFSLDCHLIVLFVHQLKICNLIWHQRSGSMEKVLCVILCMAGFILQEHEVGYHLIGHFWMVSINSFSFYWIEQKALFPLFCPLLFSVWYLGLIARSRKKPTYYFLYATAKLIFLRVLECLSFLLSPLSACLRSFFYILCSSHPVLLVQLLD